MMEMKILKMKKIIDVLHLSIIMVKIIMVEDLHKTTRKVAKEFNVEG